MSFEHLPHFGSLPLFPHPEVPDEDVSITASADHETTPHRRTSSQSLRAFLIGDPDTGLVEGRGICARRTKAITTIFFASKRIVVEFPSTVPVLLEFETENASPVCTNQRSQQSAGAQTPYLDSAVTRPGNYASRIELEAVNTNIVVSTRFHWLQGAHTCRSGQLFL